MTESARRAPVGLRGREAERPTLRGKIMVPTVVFGLAVILNVVGLGLLGWMY